MIFVSNLSLSTSLGKPCYGDGPIRYVDNGTTHKVVLVDSDNVVATLFEVVKTAVSGDEDIALIMVKDER